MFRKNYFSFLIAAALFLSGSLFVFAQTSPVRGKVELRKADGTTEPVAGATVEVFRTDLKGKLSPTKTGKKGEFAFAGFMLGQTFALSISAPNIQPQVYPNVKGGNENIVITVVAGDGKKLTEDEVRQTLAAPQTNTPNATGNAQPALSAAELKKAQEEQAKLVAQYETQKKSAESNYASVKKAFDAGNQANTAKNYDLAIAKFDEGIAVDPNFEGSAPILLNAKGLALINRATITYNQSTKADAATRLAALETAKKDFQNAIASADRALEILSKAAAGDAENQKKMALSKSDALKNKKEAYRLMSKTGADRSKAKEAMTAFQEYMALETDPKLKSEAQLALALTLQDANDFDQAIVEFKKILDSDPNNIDALAGMGLSLVNVGYVNNDKTKFQEAANYLQKFADLAPDTNPLKAGALETIDTLKKEQSVAPQKVNKTATKKKP
jgi:tetratricopeptide (TPR) repeat protein